MNKNFFKILSYAEVLSFGKAQRNRKEESSHVNDFLNVIRSGKSKVYVDGSTYIVFGPIPIVINPKTGHVLDGQHRLAAFKKAYEAGLIDDNARILVSFWEIDDEEAENTITIGLNSKTKNWRISDYMDSYSQYLEPYSKLIAFCKSHTLCRKTTKNGKEKLNYRYAAAMITGAGQQKQLIGGTLTFTDEQLRLGNTIHNELFAIRKKLGLPYSGEEIESMAVEWHSQRQFMTVEDIISIRYIPKSVAEKKIMNKSDWRVVFAELKDIVQKKKSAA